MKLKVVVITLLLGSILVGCNQSIYSVATPTIEAGGDPTFLTLVPGGNPMDMLETFVAETAIAQTQTPETNVITMDDLATFATGTAAAAQMQITPVDHAHDPMALTVILPDDSRSDFTYQSIESLTTHTLDLFDQVRQAVDLRHLLEQAYWQHYSLYSITLEGKGSLTLQVDRLPEDAALYLDQGTLNFVSGDIPIEDWPRDIVLIIVR